MFEGLGFRFRVEGLGLAFPVDSSRLKQVVEGKPYTFWCLVGNKGT